VLIYLIHHINFTKSSIVKLITSISSAYSPNALTAIPQCGSSQVLGGKSPKRCVATTAARPTKQLSSLIFFDPYGPASAGLFSCEQPAHQENSRILAEDTAFSWELRVIERVDPRPDPEECISILQEQGLAILNLCYPELNNPESIRKFLSTYVEIKLRWRMS
jgi:hypothetical protein